MESHEIIKKCFEKRSPKEISAELGVSLSLLYKWAEEPQQDGGSGATNPLDRTAQLIRLTGEEDILHWLCLQGKGYFVPEPKLKAHPESLTPAVNELVKHFALLLGDIAHASGDNRVTDDESEKLRSAWDDLRSRTESFIRACENGDYDAARRAPTGKS